MTDATARGHAACRAHRKHRDARGLRRFGLSQDHTEWARAMPAAVAAARGSSPRPRPGSRLGSFLRVSLGVHAADCGIALMARAPDADR